MCNREALGVETMKVACCMCCMNDLRGVIGITTRLRKITSGEDSAMRSARGHTSGYF